MKLDGDIPNLKRTKKETENVVHPYWPEYKPVNTPLALIPYEPRTSRLRIKLMGSRVIEIDNNKHEFQQY